MTTIDLRKTSLLAVTALSSVAALALYAPAIAEPVASWRVAQGAPQPALTDEEKKRLEDAKRRRDGDGGQPPPAPNAPATKAPETKAPAVNTPPPPPPAPKIQATPPTAPPPGAKIQATPPDAPKVTPRLVNPSTPPAPPPATVQKTAPPAGTPPATAAPVPPPNTGPADTGRNGDRATRSRDRRPTDQQPADTTTAAPSTVTPTNPPPAPVTKPLSPPPSAPAVTTAPTVTAPSVKAPATPPPAVTTPVAPKVETQPAPDGRRSDRNRPDRPDRQPAPTTPPATGTAAGVAVGGAATVATPPAGPAPKDLEDAKTGRTEKSESGNRTVIQETDRRTITRQGDRVVIQKDEAVQLKRVAPDAVITRDTAGTNTAVVERPGNVKIITETDKGGQLVRRFRRDGDGRETAIIDNRRRKKNNLGRDIAIGVGVGAGIIAGAAILNSVVDVPAPVVRVPRDKYVVRYEDASEDDVYEALNAPPVDRVDRAYTLDEVRATPRLRERMRRVDLDDINFEFGSWDVNPGEYRKLERIARAMMRVIERNPNEVFLIEGYTDAVGSDVDNLTLSDRRAESVSVILSEQFRVPFENLTTQGYGEDYLKVETDGPERANRRVAVRRITPLLALQQEEVAPPPPRRRWDDRRYDDRRYHDDRPYRRWRRYNRDRDRY